MPHVIETPVDALRGSRALRRAEVYLELENLQETGSFEAALRHRTKLAGMTLAQAEAASSQRPARAAIQRRLVARPQRPGDSTRARTSSYFIMIGRTSGR